MGSGSGPTQARAYSEIDVDVADFPRLGKRMVWRGTEVEIYDASDAQEFGPLEG